jgi:hypothetical protein
VARSGNYQDSVTAPVDRVFDDGAAMVDEENEDFEETISMPLDPSETIISAVDKVCIRALSFHLTVLLTSVRAIRSSPQRRQSWLREVKISLNREEPGNNERPLMLILDVRTRWSSTHQMMREFYHLLSKSQARF